METFVARKLSKSDADKYEEAKELVKASNKTAHKWWESITAVRDNDWYLVEFATFREWCQKYSPWSWATVRKALSEGRKAKAKKLIEETTGEPLLPDRKWVKNVPAASDSHNNNDVVINKPELSPAKKPEKVYDQEGMPIPGPLVARWNRRQEFKDLMEEVSTIKCRLEKYASDKDEIWRKVTANTTAVERAGQLYAAISEAMPHTVCSKCKGWFEQTNDGFCPSCNSTGFMSKKQYATTDESEKTLRKNYANNLQGLSSPVPRQNH